MKLLKVQQGTEQWHRERACRHTSSEAPAMMGVSSRLSRAELLRMRATGDEQHFSAWVNEVLFPRGHAVEQLSRPLAEEIIGAELFPATGVSDDDKLLASFDGITLAGNCIWECKQWNEEKAEDVCTGRVPDDDLWQVVHALVVSGADRCLYMVTDGTSDHMVRMWYSLSDVDEQRLRKGWEQFDRDLTEYTPRAEAPQAVGTSPERLPALMIEVTGDVLSSNLEAFRDAALAAFGAINRDLQTDQDFANAEQVVKWCKEVEDKLDLAKEQALTQTRSIDELFRAIDTIKNTSRQTRLELDKLVKARKQAVRMEIVQEAKERYVEHVAKLAQSLGTFGGQKAPLVLPERDFGGALRGLKTIKSLRDSAAAELTRGKILAHEVADMLRLNVARLNELADEYPALFSDWRGLIVKEPSDMEAAVKLRLAEHEKAEQARKEAAERAKKEEIERVKQAEAERVRREESERIRAEEAAKLRREPAGDLATALGRWRLKYRIKEEAYCALLEVLELSEEMATPIGAAAWNQNN